MDDKGLEVKGSRESREIGRIIVTGYGTKLPLEHVEKELKKLYASCGEITDVFIPTTRKSSLWRSGFVYFVGEGAVDKALQLNGTDMGGWTVDAEAYLFPEEDENCVELEVKGYDTSLSESDIKSELSKLFSSCGKIVQAVISKSFSIVFLVGVDAVEKAPKLSGTDLGGGTKSSFGLFLTVEEPLCTPAATKDIAFVAQVNKRPKMAEKKKEDKKPKMAQKKKKIKKLKMTAKRKIIKKPTMTLE